jgi:tetratricopeptide (TPR) repeat protein
VVKHAILGILLLAVGADAAAQDAFGKARASLGARDTTAAIAGFLEAIKIGQKTGEANFALGSIALARFRLDEAIGYLQSAVRIDDDNIEAMKSLGNAFLLKKDGTSALQAFRQAAKLGPKDCEVSIALGRGLLAADSVDAAVVHLTRAKECAPENPLVYEGLGDAYAKQNVLVLAISNYQKTVELAPKNIEAHFKLARMLEKNRQYNEAVAEYRTVAGLDSLYADAYYQQGRIFVLAKQPRNAVGPLRMFVHLQPNSQEGKLFLLKALFAAEDYVEAAKAAVPVLEADSSSAEVWRMYGVSLAETKEHAKALIAFAALRRRDTLKPADLVKVGKAQFGLGQEDSAIASYEAAVAADSTNCDPFFDMGFLYMKRQQYDNAARMFERKIVCDKGSLSAYVNAAASYMQIKNFGRARELLGRSIELKPDFFQGRLWLSRYYVQVDSFDQAEKEYGEVLRLTQDNPDKYKKERGEANALLASLFAQRKQFARAVEAFRQAAAIGYENGAMMLSWGQSLLQTISNDNPPETNQRITEEAVKKFRRCTELDPNNAQGHLWLAEGLLRSRIPGEDELNKKLKEEACLEFRKVLKLEPKNEDAKKGMERVGC